MSNTKNSTFRFGLHYYKKCIPAAVLTQLMGFAATVADLFLPLLFEMFIDYVICSNTDGNTSIFSFLLQTEKYPVHSFRLFWHLAFFYIGLLLIRIILVYLKNLINQVIGLKLETTLRYKTYAKLMSLDSLTLSNFNSGELLQTINSDTIMYKDLFCKMIPTIIDSSFAMILSIIILAGMNPWLLLVPLLLTPVFMIELRRFKKLSRERYREIRNCNSNMTLTVQENIEAVRLVRAFTNENLEEEKFSNANEKLKKAHLDQIALSAKFEAVFSSIKQAAYIGTIAVSSVLVLTGHFKIGFLVACSQYVMKIMNYVTQINNNFFQMQQQVVSGLKMLNFMNTQSKVQDTDAGITDEKNKMPSIRYENASLTLSDKKVLDKLNLQIPYGKKIGITGATGSGKSMMLEVLVRNYELSGGKIFINEKDSREYSLKELRSMFSYVFQEAFLFSNTIKSNIAYAEHGTDEQIITASRHAQAHDFISRLPEGYETIVGERGIGLSGGQKQRLSIARALMKNSPVLIFDDSTSALDVETEKKLLADVKKFYPEKTILISAHRLSSIKDCDEIIYMKDGNIAERGTFDELIKLNGHFAGVWKIQEMQHSSFVDFDSLAERSQPEGEK
ncbi:MAG: ABC transporter ATP-binding protein [Treponema sp.]|nr:ABC transporter ATP-binding protein [Treponema sp.]